MSDPKVPSWMSPAEPWGKHKAWRSVRSFMGRVSYTNFSNVAWLDNVTLTATELRELADLIDSCQEVSDDE